MNLSIIIKGVVELTVSKIKELVNKELESKEKKTRVDAAVTEWLTDNISKLGIVQQFIVAQYVVPTIPMITQLVYDCIKTKMEGVTE